MARGAGHTESRLTLRNVVMKGALWTAIFVVFEGVEEVTLILLDVEGREFPYACRAARCRGRRAVCRYYHFALKRVKFFVAVLKARAGREDLYKVSTSMF